MNSNLYIKNEIRASTDEICYADEIFGYASDEIKSTHPPSRRISPNEVGFHRRRRFHPPARVDLVEKPTCRNKSVFLVPEAGVEPARYRYHWILSPARLPIPSFRRTVRLWTFVIIPLDLLIVKRFLTLLSRFFWRLYIIYGYKSRAVTVFREKVLDKVDRVCYNL